MSSAHPAADAQAREEMWPHLLAQRTKIGAERLRPRAVGRLTLGVNRLPTAPARTPSIA
jgi:hypothetical protein